MNMGGDEKLRYVKCLDLAFGALENAMYAEDGEKLDSLVDYAKTCLCLSETYMDIDMYDLPQTQFDKEALGE